MTTAVAQFNARQREADRVHHEGRVAWLTRERPRWPCGEPVARWEVVAMLEQSQRALRLIEQGMSTSHAPPAV